MIGVAGVMGDPSAWASEDAVSAATIAVVNGSPVYVEDLERRLNATHGNVAEQRRGAPDVRELVTRTVEDILPAPSGKYRPVVSKVAEEKLREAAAGKAIEVGDRHA